MGYLSKKGSSYLKFVDVTFDGHDSQIVLEVDVSKKVVCPVNYAMIGFCSSDKENSCDGKWGSITCAPIKFDECINAADVLDSNIDLQYRNLFNQLYGFKHHFRR